MFNTINDFLTVWELETTATIACFEHLTEESLQLDLVNGYRSIERLVNHIVESAISIPKDGQLNVWHEQKYFSRVGDLYDAYVIATHKVKQAIVYWSDETLQEEVLLNGQSRKKGWVIWTAVMHQAHHRGQLTVLMRAAGLNVPVAYRESKQEWELMGLPADHW